MNSIKFLFLFSLTILFSCEKEMEDIEPKTEIPSSTEITMEQISGYVDVHRYGGMNYTPPLPNLVVKLVSNGVILDEVKGTVFGRFDFDEQSIPVDQTFIYAKATGHYPSIKKITAEGSYQRLELIPIEYKEITNHNIEETGEMIRLTADIFPENNNLFVYALNEDGELIGNQYLDSDNALKIDMAIMAGEKFYLHIRDIFCEGSTPLEFGPFEEDTDLGNLDLGEIIEHTYVNVSGENSSCDDFPHVYVFQGDQYMSRATVFSDFSYSQLLNKCNLTTDPIDVFAFYRVDGTNEYTTFSTASLDFIPDQDMVVDLTTCIENDLFLTYQLNGGIENEELLLPIIARLYSNGKVEINMDMPGTGERRSMLINGNSANHTGQLFFTHNNFPVNTSFDMYFSNEINFEITLNDGEFLEANFEGEVVNNENGGLGILTGSFRALIN